ncbi:hypothetical protein sos41_36860 [Alphaproteobacteria bacterium SO-S41]|nr:hypothetical protein sos41_36860 [Alphaproteobacteria bacterium SO-S41]
MRRFLNRYGTPLTVGLFAVSAISGIALFFHWGSALFHGMHEWLSMVLLAPFAIHLWKNWRPLVVYARRGTLLIPILLSVLIAAPFAVMAMQGGGGGGRMNPGGRSAQLMTEARLADLAPVLKTTPDALVADIKQRGYTVASADETLVKIAATAGIPANELLVALMPAVPAPQPR